MGMKGKDEVRAMLQEKQTARGKLVVDGMLNFNKQTNSERMALQVNLAIIGAEITLLLDILGIKKKGK